jgi:hypothetical protein
MDTNAILRLLEYKDSPFFLEGPRLREYAGFSHIFRRAEEFCRLRGVYTLKEQSAEALANQSVVPLVYVCEAEDEHQAAEIHKLVWNQNIVPFLLVVTPYRFSLYRGFAYEHRTATEVDSIKDQSILQAAKEATEILRKFSDFKAESIDNGTIFQNWSEHIKPNTRVDWKLLDSLKKLGKQLRNETPSLPTNIAHTLIGKYVYLWYLRERDILSDRKLHAWDIKYDEVFGRNATLSALYSLEKELENWLNGSVFPLPQKGTFKDAHVRKVASTFQGDEPLSGQMHLGFPAYNFAYIPIETLSVVYEQFLHAEGQGRKKGAYYTPIHLVNFMLDELDAKKPLKKGMKVFDASCGSGAFLVQCYRRLIERTFTPKLNKGIEPSNLSKLLTDHIYGLEVDEDACGVTELSLILTLLDYVNPPDLSKAKSPLPTLRDQNIFHCREGFFDPDSKWEKTKSKDGYNWIVGNPPWKEINAEKLDKLEPPDLSALKWMKENKTKFTVNNNQLAEAFAWKVTQSLSKRGVVGLLLPAGTLFKKTAKGFRAKFFTKTKTWCVVNFSNLRHLLFRGAVNPAAAFFYAFLQEEEEIGQNIVTYAPFAVDQLQRYKENGNKKEKLWTVIVNDCGIREIQASEAMTGQELPWKLAMWGTVRDKRLLKSVNKRFDGLSEFVKKHNFKMHQGPALRTEDANEPVDFIEEIVGQKALNMRCLQGYRHIFSIPGKALYRLDKNNCFLRRRTGKKSLEGCRPPHVIIDAAGRFAVFSNEFIVIPPRPIGISGNSPADVNLLKALSLYLSSDFAFYYQFLSSSYWGIERDRPDKKDLETLPIPLDNLSSKELSDWTNLHGELTRASLNSQENSDAPLLGDLRPLDDFKVLLQHLNELVYKVLGIKKTERWLIEDLLDVRIKLNQGAIAKEAVKPATKSEMIAYATTLKNELDDFLSEPDRHGINVYYSDDSAIIRILHLKNSDAGRPEIIEINAETQAEFAKLARQLPREQGQWIYFNRGLRFFEGRTTYIFKPRERLYWLKSQALVDADEFIADKLTAL